MLLNLNLYVKYSACTNTIFQWEKFNDTQFTRYIYIFINTDIVSKFINVHFGHFDWCEGAILPRHFRVLHCFGLDVGSINGLERLPRKWKVGLNPSRDRPKLLKQ